MTPRGTDDRTVRIRPGEPAEHGGRRAGGPALPGPLRYWLWGAAAVIVLSLAGGVVGGYLALGPARPALVAPQVAPQLASVPAPAPLPRAAVPGPGAPATSAGTALPGAAIPAAGLPIETADAATIARHVPTTLTAFRFQPNPQILVLDFPTLLEQGLMLNRVAAMVEKAGLPHDRVLTDAELDIAIKAHGDTVETYYYGHDYSAADLTAFFRRADRQGIRLDPQEEKLRRLLGAEGFFVAGSRQALITLPRAGVTPGLDETMRTAILDHELSHGEFFSNPAYAAFARYFWNSVMTEADRAAFRAFLKRDDYDPAVPDLIVNEAQAYLMSTPDARLFNATDVGLSEAELDRLRRLFLARMPDGWLRDQIAARMAGPPRPVAVGGDAGTALPGLVRPR